MDVPHGRRGAVDEPLAVLEGRWSLGMEVGALGNTGFVHWEKACWIHDDVLGLTG